ncbi:MAG: carbamoyltransferase HypF [Candidatus Omnitrophica bacterium]|nr:carbamoyltransferase HypF [Candidatus Omnitrophota bacterium]
MTSTTLTQPAIHPPSPEASERFRPTGKHVGLQRRRLTITGAVQGVGFRPFVYTLATQLRLSGWVVNTRHGISLEIEGSPEQLETFQQRLGAELPAPAAIETIEAQSIGAEGGAQFVIRPSDDQGAPTAVVLPDLATCEACLVECCDPSNRRFRYPFINCTHCGPRFSIIEQLPYDRAKTTMRRFAMCNDCRAEYDDPMNRRFHAEPNACPACGPQLQLWDAAGGVIASRDEALIRAAQAIRDGRIVAVKGLGGFHLMADARNEKAVQRLRLRKGREAKPFALMYPSMEMIEAHAEVTKDERYVLQSTVAPIVLVRRRREHIQIAEAVAPKNPWLGVMLPMTALHHLLLRELEFAVVATSGNLSEEPICTDEREALQRLASVADVWLVHDRPIARHVDDSVVRIVANRPLLLRRARGYAPLPVNLAGEPPPCLAVGAHLKNTVAIAVGDQAVLSQHLGDLETPQAIDGFTRAIESLQTFYATMPTMIACDLHPDYESSRWAKRQARPVVPIQHHVAHVLSCMADNELSDAVLGVAWDGTGLGSDGMIWGGEYFAVDDRKVERVAHLRPFRLPGGEQAIREPRRSALGLLIAMEPDTLTLFPRLAPIASLTDRERAVLAAMLSRGVQSPWTTSIGRLFDAVASLLNLHHGRQFEGQAAMALEHAAERAETDDSYSMPLIPCTIFHEANFHQQLDWEPLVRGILSDLKMLVPPAIIAAKFHNALAETIVTVAHHLGLPRVVLSGGCFQNRVLTERAILRLRREDLEPFWHRQVPPNDGGIALGQLAAVARSRSVS